MRWIRERTARCGSGDDGQVMLLILCFALIVGVLVTVVIDASSLFLQRRALTAAADGVALAAAQAIDESAIYQGHATDWVPLDPERVDEAARAYVRSAGLEESMNDFQVVAVRTDGIHVDVELASRVHLPFANMVTASGDGVELHASARAASAIG